MNVNEAITYLRSQELGFTGNTAVDVLITQVESQRWIPVSDRLPAKEDADENGLVRVWIPEFDCSDEILYKFLYVGSTKISHWMSPPKPPEVV